MQSRARWQRDQQVIEALSSLLNYVGEPDRYLERIASSVCSLLRMDVTVITLCEGDGFDRVIASSDGEEDHELYTLHGTVTGTVVSSGRSLVVEDIRLNPEAGEIPDGYLCYLGVPLRTPQGDIIGTVCSFHDLPRKFAEEEVRTAELFAERAAMAIAHYRLYQEQQRFNEMLEAEVIKRTQELRAAQTKLIEQERLAAIGEFAAMIVHEIRNPLTTVKMGLKAFGRLALAEPDQLRLTLANEEANRLEDLLNEILQFSKPQRAMRAESVNLAALLQDVVTQVQETPLAQGRMIELAIAPNLPPVVGDRNKLKQVCLNLVRNACEAVTEGDRIRCVLLLDAATSDSPQKLCLSIHNGGPPIPPEDLPKLTRPFYSTKTGGTGLGLALVKRIIDAHSGSLSIQSTAAEGTTVAVRLPTSL
ncbi:ATP-binding protein [Thermoleptolyngbya sp.]